MIKELADGALEDMHGYVDYSFYESLREGQLYKNKDCCALYTAVLFDFRGNISGKIAHIVSYVRSV